MAQIRAAESGAWMQSNFLTFSNFSFTGLGLVAVTASAISWPILNDCSLVAPFRSTNILKKENNSQESTKYGYLFKDSCLSQAFVTHKAKTAYTYCHRSDVAFRSNMTVCWVANK